MNVRIAVLGGIFGLLTGGQPTMAVERWPAAAPLTGEESTPQSAALLARLIGELASVPASEEGYNRLSRLLGGGYRVPGLSFVERNKYWRAISERSEAIRRTVSSDRCTPLVNKVNMPADALDAIIPFRSGEVSVKQFVCAAYVAHGAVIFQRAPKDGEVLLKFGGLTLTFRLGHYVRENQAFFPLASPVKQGVKAFWPVYVTGPRAAGPMSQDDVLLLYSEYTPQLATYLASK